jgi:hypothetical protein
MKTMMVAGVLCAVLIGMAAVASADEPKGFRSVPWGASEEILRSRIPTQSCDVVDPGVDFGTRRCVAAGGVTFGRVRPNAVFFYFRNDMLVAWQISAHPRFRATLGRSLLAQYGKPTVVYTGNHVTWKGRTCDLDFVGGAVQDTVVAVTKAELMTREAERRESAHRPATRP